MRKIWAKFRATDTVETCSNFWDQALVNKYGEDVIKIKKVNKRKEYNVNVLKKNNIFKLDIRIAN